jgi:5'-nucleotidase
MRILIANDDGIHSPGLLALAEAASRFGDVRIVAPDVEQSSMGHAITHSRPLTCRRTARPPFEAYRVNGTPADCVALGSHLWTDGVDVVLSGINLGLNLGNSTWHSGTLAAAKQAALLGLRGVALSAPVDRQGQADFARLQPHVEAVLAYLLDTPEWTLVNVNFPADPRGVLWTRQSVRHYDGSVVRSADPMGREIFWLTVTPLEAAEEGTDRWAVEHDLVSMTPLRLDLTDKRQLTEIQATAPARLRSEQWTGGDAAPESLS